MYPTCVEIINAPVEFFRKSSDASPKIIALLKTFVSPQRLRRFKRKEWNNQHRPAEELLWLLSRLVVFCREGDNQVGRQFALCAGELPCLQAIWHDPECKIKELTHRLGPSSSRLSRILDKLEDRGLVVRSIDRKDRRKIHVELKGHGAEFVRKLEDSLIQFYYQKARSLPAEYAESMIHMMRQIVDSLTQGRGDGLRREVMRDPSAA